MAYRLPGIDYSYTMKHLVNNDTVHIQWLMVESLAMVEEPRPSEIQ